MIVVRYALCSERAQKPLTRAVFDSKAEADRALQHIQQEDANDPSTTHWLAEVGPESEDWRWLDNVPSHFE